MNAISILAEVSPTSTIQQDIEVVRIDLIWEQISSLNGLQAVVAVSFGVVWLLYGWRIFKVLAVISFALMGLYVGMWFGDKLGSQFWGGTIGLVALSVISIPLMKWCVCVLGAIAGGTLTSGLWYAFGFTQTYIWAGAVIGIIAGGMISFIIFKAAVMLFTSLGGSAITVVGILALLHLYETSIAQTPTQHIQDFVFGYKWFLPLAVLIPTLGGILMQHKLVKGSQDWEM